MGIATKRTVKTKGCAPEQSRRKNKDRPFAAFKDLFLRGRGYNLCKSRFFNTHNIFCGETKTFGEKNKTFCGRKKLSVGGRKNFRRVKRENDEICFITVIMALSDGRKSVYSGQLKSRRFMHCF